MKYQISITAYDPEVTARALLIGIWHTVSTMPPLWQEAFKAGDLDFAMKRHAATTSTAAVRGLERGFKTKKEAQTYAHYMRRTLDFGWGLMCGRGLVLGRIYDDIVLKPVQTKKKGA